MLFASLIILLAGLTWLTPVTIQQPQINQEQERIIVKRSWHKDPTKSNEPIKIKAIKVKGAPVALGRKFLADEDWLKRLAVTVSNNSRRPVRFISIDVDCFFPIITAQEPFYTSSLTYGHILLGTTGLQSDERKSSLPEESLTLAVPEEELASIRASLIELGRFNFQRIELTVRKVIFEDGQMWYAGWFCDSQGRCSPNIQPKVSPPFTS
jgi:hypothetical protein